MHMSKIGKRNEWKDYVEGLSRTTSSQDMRESLLKSSLKKHYKSVIDSQLQEKQHRALQESNLKEQEALRMYQSLNDFEQFKRSKHIEQQSSKVDLYNYYLNQINKRQDYHSRLIDQNLILEKSIIIDDLNKASKLRAEQAQKKSMKINAEKEFLLQKQHELYLKQRQNDREKEQDVSLISSSMEKSLKAQQSHHSIISKIQKRQESQQNSYIPALLSQSAKSKALSDLVGKWEDDVYQRNLAIDLANREQTIRRKREVNLTLKSQINEKEQRKQIEKLEVSIEKEDSDISIYQTRHQLSKFKIEDLYRKKQYKEYLQSQMKEKEAERSMDMTLNQREKEINTKIAQKLKTDELIEFKGVPGVYRSQSSLEKAYENSTRHRASSVNEKTLNRSIQQDSSDRKLSLMKRMLRTENTKHDPILNPIGSKIDLNSSFHRGRGMNSLFY